MTRQYVSHAIANPWDEIERALGGENFTLTTRCGETIETLSTGKASPWKNTTDCPACHPRSSSPVKPTRPRTTGGRDSAPHYVYRLYSETGDLLYVGLTCDPRARRLAHKNTQPWWDEVASWRVTIYPSRAHAARVERLSIWAEQPRYNRVGKGYYPIVVDRVDPAIVEGLRRFDAEYAAAEGSSPSQTIRRREALRLLKGGAA